MPGIKLRAQAEGSGSRLVGIWPSTGMAAAQLRWGQNEALVSKPLQREMAEPTPGHFLAGLSGRAVFKARPLPHC